MFKTLLSFFSIFVVLNSYAQESISNKNNSSLNLEWKSRGPINVSGITTSLLWDKDDENTIYAGGIAGGLFKTTNKGETWQSVASYKNSNPAVSSLAQSINGTIFVGTGFITGQQPNGTLFNYSFGGDGIYKSNDQGTTWTSILATDEYPFPTGSGEWSSVRTMATHPTNTNILMVGNNIGVKISTNAELTQPTFVNATGVPGDVSDVEFTSDGQEAWAAAGGRIYHSTDFANNFISFNINMPTNVFSTSRAEIALSAVDNNGDYTIYASFTSSSGCLIGVYKSEDKGANWTQIAFSGGADPYGFANGSCQGWYSNTLAVNPNNKDIIYIGGVTLYTITPQGDLVQIDDTQNESASDYIADDKHDIVFNPFNADEMMVATDLGVFLSNNALTGHPYNISFDSKNNDLNNSNALNAGLGKNGDILISGFQSTHYLDYSSSQGPYHASKTWNQSNITAEISNYEESVFLYSGVYGSLKKSINYGNNNFPFLDINIDPGNCNHITCSPTTPTSNCALKEQEGGRFYGEQYLYESENKAKYVAPSLCGSKLFLCTNPLSLTNEPIFSSLNIPLQSGTNDMDFSNDGDRMVFVTGSRIVIVDGLDSFTPSIPDDISLNTAQIDTSYFNLNSIGISSLAGISIDKNNKDHIIVVEDGYGSNSKVFKTIDGGLTWSNIHNNLPETPVFDCIIDANNSNNYILATYEGIYTSNDAGLTWNEDNMGMGKVPLFRIKQEWVLEENCYILLAATAGKGVYTSTTLTNCNKNVEEEIWGLFNPIKNLANNNINIKIYPNPTQENFHIEIVDTDFESKNIRIFDVLGKQVYSGTIEDNLEVRTTNWTSGIYYISIENTFAKVIVH